jgi:hypothetical protein
VGVAGLVVPEGLMAYYKWSNFDGSFNPYELLDNLPEPKGLQNKNRVGIKKHPENRVIYTRRYARAAYQL